MNVHDVGSLSLGQWAAISRGWAKAHGQLGAEPPTEDEFHAAVMAARQ